GKQGGWHGVRTMASPPGGRGAGGGGPGVAGGGARSDHDPPPRGASASGGVPAEPGGGRDPIMIFSPTERQRVGEYRRSRGGGARSERAADTALDPVPEQLPGDDVALD